MKIGLIHPGEMGAAIGAVLVTNGHEVLWASEGRSDETRDRAKRAGVVDVGDISVLGEQTEAILSVCPPHAALDVARQLRGYRGIYVDANAVSPVTVREIAQLFDRCVDGGIIGPPPRRDGDTRLYLSGEEAGLVAALFDGTLVAARVVSHEIGDASAVKLAYAAWTKGSAALLLAVRAAARANGVEDIVLEEWAISQPGVADRSATAGVAALTKGWRWAGEMDEIADMFEAAGLPEGFHRAAAEIYSRSPRGELSDIIGNDDGATAPTALEQVLRALTDATTRSP